VNRRAVFYLGFVFLLGAALGAGGLFVAGKRGLIHLHPDPRDHRRGVVERLTRELNLSAEQRGRLEVILEETASQYRELHARMRTEREQIRQAGRQRIREILSEAQREKFEEVLRQFDAKRARRQPSGPPGAPSEERR
jgi:hypothetical protein